MTPYNSKLLFIKKYYLENINFSAALKNQNQKLIDNTIKNLLITISCVTFDTD